MTVKLNATDKIQFPTMEVWARFFKDWSESLIEGLGNQHDLMDRQDAVSNAFVKLMFKKGIEDTVIFPRPRATGTVASSGRRSRS